MLAPAFVLNILNNIIRICYYIYESFSVFGLTLLATDFHLVRDANTNSFENASKIL